MYWEGYRGDSCVNLSQKSSMIVMDGLTLSSQVNRINVVKRSEEEYVICVDDALVNNL